MCIVPDQTPITRAENKANGDCSFLFGHFNEAGSKSKSILIDFSVKNLQFSTRNTWFTAQSDFGVYRYLGIFSVHANTFKAISKGLFCSYVNSDSEVKKLRCIPSGFWCRERGR